MKRFRLVDPTTAGEFIRYTYQQVYYDVKQRKRNPEIIRRYFWAATSTFFFKGEIPM